MDRIGPLDTSMEEAVVDSRQLAVLKIQMHGMELYPLL